MNELIIIPRSEDCIIASLEGEVITEIGKIDIPGNSKSIITKNNLIVSLCFDSKTPSARLIATYENGYELIK